MSKRVEKITKAAVAGNVADLKRVLDSKASKVSIETPDVFRVGIEIIGTASLIQNNFTQKAMEEMLRKSMGFAVERKPKRPREIIEDAHIRNMMGEVSIPPQAIKAAMISSLTPGTKFPTSKQMRTLVYIEGQSIPIKFREMIPRVDMVRLKNIGRSPDVRFRPEFQEWLARFVVAFQEPMRVETVIEHISRAGRNGVGEWRPERNGTFGTFKINRLVDNPRELGDIEASCRAALVGLKVPAWAMDKEIDTAMIKKLAGQDMSVDDYEEEGEAAEVGKAATTKRGKTTRVAKAPAPLEKWQPQEGACNVTGCERPKRCRGYCGAHYQAARTNGWPVPAPAGFQPPQSKRGKTQAA